MTRTVLLALLCAAVVYALHRLASWAEDRGWVYYRKDRGRSGTVSGAMLEIQSLLQPSARHAIEETRRSRESRADPGDSSGGPGERHPDNGEEH